MAIQILGLAIAFMTTVIVTRHLDTDGFGRFSVLLNAIVIISSAANLGFHYVLLRETSKSQSEDEAAVARRKVAAASIAVTGVSAVVSLAFAGFIIATMTITAMSALLIGLQIAGVAIGDALCGALRGFGHNLLYQTVTLTRTVLILAGVVVYTQVSPEHATMEGILWIYTAGAFAIIPVVALYLRRAGMALRDFGTELIWPVMKEGGPFIITVTLNLANRRVLTVLMPLFVSLSEVGVFALALTLFNAYTTLVYAPVVTITARMGQAIGAKDIPALQHQMNFGALLSGVMAIAGVAGVLVVGPFLLDLLFGPNFAGAKWPLFFLCAALVVDSCFGPTGEVLWLSNRMRLAVLLEANRGAMVLVGTFILVPIYGIAGGGLGFLFGVLIADCIQAYIVWKEVGVKPAIFALAPRMFPWLRLRTL
ncbi:lipopolysaccharide biosynthesis protein [Chthonobacter albigriseus]|uniref:lipopolysaccharide biosynthesis protein n=1 Tax=Chthonobacter albigriseus TaxID=1683161 RepID=UPI0015EE62CC|nr:oligosaccharide flippase family protein [Chthonobacter albigriseus]